MFSTINEKQKIEISNEIKNRILPIFGNDITCIILHGSVVKGGFIKHFSDVDVQVFLKADTFDRYGIPLMKSIETQKAVGDIDFSDIGIKYLQMYFYNTLDLPSWYTPPLEGTYRVIFGSYPNELVYDVEDFKKKMVQYLKNIDNVIPNLVKNFADSSNNVLFRRLRYLETDVVPTMYSLCSFDLENPEKIWAKPKNDIIALVEEKYRNQQMTDYLKQFFEKVGIVANNPQNYEAVRSGFELGIRFLMEVSNLVKDI